MLQDAAKVALDTAAIKPLRARCETSPAGSAVMAIIVKTSWFRETTGETVKGWGFPKKDGIHQNITPIFNKTQGKK